MKIENLDKWDVKELVKNKGVVGLNKAIKADNGLVRLCKKMICIWGKKKIGVVDKMKSKGVDVSDL